MWFGKVAIIMYIFAFGLLFGGYYIDDVFGLDLFTGVSYEGLDTIANSFNPDQDITTDLIFGDFIAAAKVLFGVMTGETVASGFSILPHMNEMWMLLVRIIWVVSSLCLWVYIIASRSI